MNRNGFTLIEMLIAIVVLCTIAAIAFPLRAIHIKNKEQVSVKDQLVTIKESQDKYKMEHGTFTTDATKLANWRAGIKKYRFQIEYADKTRFRARAAGSTDDNEIFDDTAWTIDQSGMLTQVK